MTKDVCEERIKELYRELGYKSASAMARDCGIKPSSMNLYLSGVRHPDLEALYKLCSSFDCSADWLLGLTDVRSQSVDVRMAVKELDISERFIDSIRHLDPESRKYLFYLLGTKGFIETLLPEYQAFKRLEDELISAAVSNENTDSEKYCEPEYVFQNGQVTLSKIDAVRFYAEKVGNNFASLIQESTE